MLNLYAQVTSEPNNLDKVLNGDLHSKNIEEIEKILNRFPNSDILACWGNLINKRDYLKKVCLKEIFEVTKNKCFHIGSLTEKGNPRHPLYTSFDDKLENFDINEYVKNI